MQQDYVGFDLWSVRDSPLHVRRSSQKTHEDYIRDRQPATITHMRAGCDALHINQY